MKGSSRTGKNILFSITILLFANIFLWRCANIASPQGGPRDTLPPRVMSANPDFNTTNFDQKRIFIGFDEFIQLKDQSKEFFTSPAMKKKPLLMVKGKGLQIDMQDTLLENTTYALNFGSSIRDYNEGNPLNGFRYVFSTGPEIDSMFMSGYTVDAYKKDSVSKTLIFFYEAAVDSIPDYDSTLLNSQPAVIARAESNGIFIAQNLKPIDYRVYAIEDKNNNFMYDPGTDKVGFLDGVFNPAEMPDFDAWFDTTRHYMSADPQLYFRMFEDKRFQRQNLVEKSRPLQHKVMLYFGAPYPQIDSLILEGIDSSRMITEYVTPRRDTMNIWLNVPGEELPDTIKGRITYLKHDSINELVPATEQLRLHWRHVETKEEQRARERLEKDREKALEAGEEFEEPEVPNPFKFKNNAGSELNPEHNVVLEFDYPLVRMDSSQVSLIRIDEEEKRYRIRYDLSRDTMNIRKWTIAAPWTAGSKYELTIPEGALENVAGEINDTINSSFTILTPDKFGSLIVNVKGKTDTSMYVLQLLSDKDNILQEKPYATTGQYTFSYISPGEVKIRIVEDMNGNGKWDPGNLIERKQPERVEIYVPDSGEELSTIKVNWDIELDIDMNKLFKPIDIMDIRRQLELQEDIRARRLMEELLKKQGQKQGQGQGQRQSGTSFRPGDDRMGDY